MRAFMFMSCSSLIFHDTISYWNILTLQREMYIICIFLFRIPNHSEPIANVPKYANGLLRYDHS